MKVLSKAALRKRARICLNVTWERIGGDILQALAESGDESGSIPKDHVIEIVLDADHYRAHGDDDEAADYIDSLDHTGKMNLGFEAFEYDNYGW